MLACMCADTDLAVHSVELVVKGHGEVGGSAGGYVGDERGLALVDRVVHVHTTLTDLHVLEAGFDTTRKGKVAATLQLCSSVPAHLFRFSKTV